MTEPRHRRLGLVLALVAPLAVVMAGATQRAPSDPERVLSERFQFSPEDVALARSGQPVARMMIASGARDELAVMGALRLDGDKKRLVNWVTNIQQFRHAAELGLTRAIGSPPAVEAFAELVPRPQGSGRAAGLSSRTMRPASARRRDREVPERRAVGNGGRVRPGERPGGGHAGGICAGVSARRRRRARQRIRPAASRGDDPRRARAGVCHLPRAVSGFDARGYRPTSATGRT